MNKLVIIGNIVRDPNLSVANTASGQVPVCRFTVAVNKRVKSNGESGADFFNVTAWRGLADICGKYLRKGARVAVEGSVSVSTSVGKSDGKTYANLEVNASEVEFLSSKSESSGGSFTPASHEPRSSTPPAPKATPVDDPDDPFKPNFPDDYNPDDLPF